MLEELLATRNQTQKFFSGESGVDAETHDYILTGQEDSKFGFDVASGEQQKRSFAFYQIPLLMCKGSIAILARKFLLWKAF